MIIKSMSRKTASFGQLMSYIEREKGESAYRIRYNVLGRDPAQIRREFEINSDLLKKRKNGVYLFHEIISITRSEGLSEAEHKVRLQQIAEDYVAARCPDNMVFGGLHADKEHSYHYHLMISSNAVGEEKRLRLSKARFREIQVRAEQDVLKNYPELQQDLAIGKTASEKRNDRAHHVLKRGDKLTKREAIKDRVYAAWSKANDRESLIEALRDQDLSLNLKKSLSITDQKTGLHHRIKTLDPELFHMVEHTLGLEASHASGQQRSEQEKEERSRKTKQDQSSDKADPRSQSTKEAGSQSEQSKDPKSETETASTEKSAFARDVENIYARKQEKKGQKNDEKVLSQKLRQKPKMKRGL